MNFLPEECDGEEDVRLDPFKVRRGDMGQCIAAAIRMFGQPAELTQGWTSAEVRWHFYDESLIEYVLQIRFHNESETLSMKLEAHRTREDQTLCGAIVKKSTKRLIKEFIEEVRKPWSEWTEEEIMKGAMWVCLYRDEGNDPTPAMDNMMHMLSFQRPEDNWVRRYFGRRD